MRRRVFNVLAGVSVVLCVGVVSVFTFGPFWWGMKCLYLSQNGGLVWIRYEQFTSETMGYSRPTSRPVGRKRNLVVYDPYHHSRNELIGVALEETHYPSPDVGRLDGELPSSVVRERRVTISPIFWGATLLFLPALWATCCWRRRYRRKLQEERRRFRCCTSCGYDLRATVGRCPECGREVREVG